MATHESKGMNAARLKKEQSLAAMRTLQLHQLEGKLVWADDVERKWGEAMIRLRSALLAIPSRCAGGFPDPRHAESVIRAEVETALKQLDRA
jgi:hypothetical protein